MPVPTPLRTALIAVWLALPLGGGLAGLSGPAFAEDLQVTDADSLARALRGAEAGSLILLAGGDYGPLDIRGLAGTATAPVVLRAADPADPARFSRLNLNDVQHLEMEGLVFDYAFAAGDKPNMRPFQITASQGIAIRGGLFDGDEAQGISAAEDGFGVAFGLSVRATTGLLVENSEIRRFLRGLVVSESADLIIRGNDLHAIRSDGMNFAQVEGLLIEDNHIHDFIRSLKSSDHSDMIQIWTNGTKVASRGITIRNNVLNSGRGLYTQSIFMRNDQVDRGIAGPEMFYRDVVIEGNIIINAHLHGITVGETAGLSIRNNTLIRNAASEGAQKDDGLWTPRISVAKASRDVSIQNNVTSAVAGPDGQADWAVSGNFLIQDTSPTRPGYYDTVFVAARTGDAASLAPFAYLPGGPLDGTGIGAPGLNLAASGLGAPDPAQTQPAVADGAEALIRVQADPVWLNRFQLDASFSRTGAEQPTQIAWDFGDGTRALGPVVTHTYGAAGIHTVGLTLTMADGTRRAASTDITVPGPEVLSFEAGRGAFTTWASGEAQPVAEAPAGDGPVMLGQGAEAIVIPPEQIAPFFGARDFELRLRLRALGDQPAGEVLRVHTALLVLVGKKGTIELRLTTATDAQELRLKTAPLRLLAGDWHDIRIAYSSTSGEARIEVDGRLQARGRSSGVLKPMQAWGLALGNPFDPVKSFDGALESLHLRTNTEAFAPAG